MKETRSKYIKTLLLPCLGYSTAAGFISALLVTAFKYAAELTVAASKKIYSLVISDPIWLPCLILGAAAIGLVASLVLSRSDSSRGGGIPTSVAAIRGLTGFNWILSIVLLPFSALLTFFAGVPLGTEGPAVQMGTAVGDGVVHIFGGKKHRAWRRYIMTGGAAAGFSMATGAPITAILFSMEELQKRFSPLLLTVASVSVVTSRITMHLLALVGIGSESLFHIDTLEHLPVKFIYAPLLLGLACGVCAILFTLSYHSIDRLIRKTLKRISPKVKFPLIFALTALIGFFVSEILWSGHSLIDALLATENIWYILIIALLLRALLLMTANTSGVTGGIFLPTLAFGALIGALLSDGLVAIGALSTDYKALMIVLGMVAFLGSTSRIPITAAVFAIEALGGSNNVMYVILTVTIALMTVEASRLEDFTDTVIESKLHAIHKDKEPLTVEVTLTVSADSFAVGKNIADLLWPASCTLISTEKREGRKDSDTVADGDKLTVLYKTYDPEATAEEFEWLVGDQTEDIDRIMRPDLKEKSKV